MSSLLLAWMISLWLGCAPSTPAPAQGGNALEQMEAEIARIVEQVRPSVVGVSVSRTRHHWRIGVAPDGMQRLRVQGVPAPAPEDGEDDADEEMLDRMREQAEIERDHAEKLRDEAEALAESSEELRGHLLTLEGRLAPMPGTLAQRWLGATQGLAGRSIGSGFAIDGGFVITTHTLVAGGDEITLSFSDGKEAKGKLVGSDDATDIALIKVEESSVPALRLGDSSKCRVGSIGVFLSRSYGSLDNVDFGFVTGREETGGGEMLRLNFPIGPGESGSPLLSSRGEVVGIASANLRKNVHIYAPTARSGSDAFSLTMEAPEPAWGSEGSREFSYFIPAERVKAVVEDLKQYGEVRRAWFGVSGTDTTIKISATEKQRGVLVEEVVESSSAQKAGIQVGDILLRCNGQPTPNFSSLRAVIEKLVVGKAVKVAVRRSGKEIELEVTPMARPSQSKAAKGGSGDLGLSLVPKSKELASYLNLADSPDGKVVASVAKDSLAERAGIRKGDLLLDDPKPGKVIRVWRDGKTIEIEIPAK